jgi:hypothetical protein
MCLEERVAQRPHRLKAALEAQIPLDFRRLWNQSRVIPSFLKGFGLTTSGSRNYMN